MSLPHALLTALLEQEGSGLELAGRFDRSIGNYWHATHQQIYRELARLEEAGWVESTPDETARGKKRIYRVLPAGKLELRRWVSTPIELKPVRDVLMVRLHAEVMLGGDAIMQQVSTHHDAQQSQLPALQENETELAKNITRRIALHQARLVKLRQLEKAVFKSEQPNRQEKTQRMILASSIMQESLAMKICLMALDVLVTPV